MMKKYVQLFAGSVLLAAAASAVAQPAAKDRSLDEVKDSINSGLQKGKPGIVVTEVEASPIPGLYKATIGDGPHVYVTGDGQYFIAGDVFQVKPGEIVNLTDQARNGDRAKAVASVDKEDMIIFSPDKEKVKKVLYVFTDVDCGYCQLLHSKMPEYNELGIEVRYLAYPRAGIGSKSANKLVSAWCADDPNEALTKLKERKPIPDKSCADNPVAEQYNLGRSIGLTGTPALVLENGELISGYLEPAKLAKALDL